MGDWAVLLLLVRYAASACPSDLNNMTVTSAIKITEKCTFSVSGCSFIRITGPAITTEASGSVVFIRDSLFESCTKNGGYGGACDFALCANATLVRCCGYKCYAAQGQFYRSVVREWNRASEICTLLCGRGSGQDTIQWTYGQQILERVNYTSNTVGVDGAAVESWESSDSRFSQWSVVSCKGTGLMSLSYTDTSSVRGNCFMINVINNTVTSNAYGLVAFSCRWNVSAFAFFGNSGNEILRHRYYRNANPTIWENSFMTLVDCVSDAEITGDAFELVNHQISTEITKTHEVLVLACEYRYVETPVFMDNIPTTRAFVAFQLFVHLIHDM